MDADGGGRGRRGQRALCAQVGWPLPLGGRARLARSLLGATPGRESHARGSGCGDREAASAALHGGRDRRDAGDAALDGLGDPDRLGPGAAGPDRARAAGPLRAPTTGRARPHRREAARPNRGRRRQARRRRPTPTQRRRPTATAGIRRTDRLGVRPRRRRRLQPARLRRGAPRRERRHRDRLPPPRASPSTPATASRRAGPHRQRRAYVSARTRSPAERLGIRHLRTRPYRPQTNGKAERFIRTLLNGWAYGAIYRSSHERTAALDGWLWHYNHRRRHSALGHQPPVSRTNLLGSYT